MAQVLLGQDLYQEMGSLITQMPLDGIGTATSLAKICLGHYPSKNRWNQKNQAMRAEDQKTLTHLLGSGAGVHLGGMLTHQIKMFLQNQVSQVDQTLCLGNLDQVSIQPHLDGTGQETCPQNIYQNQRPHRLENLAFLEPRPQSPVKVTKSQRMFQAGIGTVMSLPMMHLPLDLSLSKNQ